MSLAVVAGQLEGHFGSGILIEALLDDVLEPGMLQDAVEVSLRIVHGDTATDRGMAAIDADLRRVDHERQRLMTASPPAAP